MNNLMSTVKQTINAANKALSPNEFTLKRKSFFYVTALLAVLSFTGCKKDGNGDYQKDTMPENNTEIKNDKDFAAKCNGTSKQTVRELLQARAATARYLDFNNAVADQYTDINLVMPNMGYHFMKSGLVNAGFDPTRPELLVYNKDSYGRFHLVSVEYAVPIALSPNAPEGFTGNADVWDFNTANSGLWTLHAWIWKFNPDGVFNPTNPLVHVL